VIDHLNRLLAPFGGITAHGRDLQMSHMVLDSEIKEQRVLGTVLPSIVFWRSRVFAECRAQPADRNSSASKLRP